jgi:hypothetical protein
MAARKPQEFVFTIPKGYSDAEQKDIADAVVDHIRERTAKGVGVDRKGNRVRGLEKFPKYSQSYKESLSFKIGGKSNKVDLTLSGDMLGALDVLEMKNGKIKIGYEEGTREYLIAEGNILGTYGTDKADPSRARDFLGVTPKELADILKQFPLENKRTKQNAAINEASKRAAPRARKGIQVDDLEDEGDA